MNNDGIFKMKFIDKKMSCSRIKIITFFTKRVRPESRNEEIKEEEEKD